jgi:hypothetical protein
VNEKDYTPYWHCSLDVDPQQLGCSITPLRIVQEALIKTGRPSGRTFKHIHQNKYTLPWRCLVRCPHIIDIYSGPQDSIPEGFGAVHVYRRVPQEVAALFRVNETTETRYETDFEFIPKRVVVMDLGNLELPTINRVVGEAGDNESLPVIRKF